MIIKYYSFDPSIDLTFIHREYDIFYFNQFNNFLSYDYLLFMISLDYY